MNEDLARQSIDQAYGAGGNGLCGNSPRPLEAAKALDPEAVIEEPLANRVAELETLIRPFSGWVNPEEMRLCTEEAERIKAREESNVTSKT
jgi:hypothetical protein